MHNLSAENVCAVNLLAFKSQNQMGQIYFHYQTSNTNVFQMALFRSDGCSHLY